MTKEPEKSEEESEQEPVSENEFSYDLKIPEERIAVLIGAEGKVKKEIEEQTKCKLDITKEGDVTITGEDGLMLFITKEIVRAVGRGFNPKIALQLLKTDYALEIIDLRDYAGKNKNTLERIKARVIGTGGRAREEVERLTETHVSVYGKTVGIIGETEHVTYARQALEMLLEGAMHKTAYHFLERKRKDMVFG